MTCFNRFQVVLILVSAAAIISGYYDDVYDNYMSSWKNWHTVWPNIIFIAIIMKLPANILNGCRYMAKNI